MKGRRERGKEVEGNERRGVVEGEMVGGRV